MAEKPGRYGENFIVLRSQKMKKNGKKYRKLQKEKELILQQNQRSSVEQEVEDIKTIDLAMAHILIENPIIYDAEDTKKKYLEKLKLYVKLCARNKRKYEASELLAYDNILHSFTEIKDKNDVDFYRYFILFDLIHVLGYDLTNISTLKIENLKKQYFEDFKNADSKIVTKILNCVQGEERRLTNLYKLDALKNESNYIKLVRNNLSFKKQRSFGILVTATMSAGKSTFINSLIGKYVCLSQNMACTSKIHSIINKAFEDGYSSEFDHDLVLTAGKEELLNDHEENQSNMIYVATNYFGELSNSRIVVSDSPGVNFSGDKEHQKIAEQLIKKRNYNMLIYVMNATQLGTNDDSEHLDFIKRTIGRSPILFVMNKIDALNPDDEDVETIINRQREYLKRKDFKNPMVCPISARAGYLSKKFEESGLTKSEERELYNYVDKFDKINLPQYYSKLFPQIKIKDKEKEETQLLKTSGMIYVEKIIKKFIEGER